MSRRILLAASSPILALALAACADDGGESETTLTTTTLTTSSSGGMETETSAGMSGDGDGDASTSGDGDGDPSTSGDGDGDASTSGDGDGDASTSGDGDGDGGVKFDMGAPPDAPDTDSGGDCLECGVTLDSTQSSSFIALPGTEYLGFATLQQDQIIYALDDPGSGRVIYTADTNLLYEEITDCPLWEWLGQTGDALPNVLSFGRYLCNGVGNSLGNYPSLTYAGDNLPAQYIDNPAQLAADYDAVIYCTLASTSDAELLTIVDYVLDHGGGLYLASEYWGFINQGDLDSVNVIAEPLGTQFQATNLDWGQANGDIGFECFPPPQ